MVVGCPAQEAHGLGVQAQHRPDGECVCLDPQGVGLLVRRFVEEHLDEHLQLVVLRLPETQHLLSIHPVLGLIEDFQHRLLSRAPRGRSQGDGLPAPEDVLPFQTRPDLIHQQLGLLLGEVGQEDDKLITAHPAYGGMWRAVDRQGPRYRDQEFVTGTVPEDIVGEFEAVDIADDDRVGQDHPSLCLCECLVEVGTVIETGELVVEAEVGDPLLGRLALGVVGEGDHRPYDRAVLELGVCVGKDIE